MYVLVWGAVYMLTRGLFWCLLEINTKITLKWVHKQFVTRVQTLFYFLHESINGFKTRIFTHHPRVSLARFTFCWWRHNLLAMMSQWPDNCDDNTWQVISNSLDIDFIHSDIQVQSCKNNLSSLTSLAMVPKQIYKYHCFCDIGDESNSWTCDIKLTYCSHKHLTNGSTAFIKQVHFYPLKGFRKCHMSDSVICHNASNADLIYTYWYFLLSCLCLHIWGGNLGNLGYNGLHLINTDHLLLLLPMYNL